MPNTDLEKAKAIIKKTINPECEACFEGACYFAESLCQSHSAQSWARIELLIQDINGKFDKIISFVGGGNGKS